MLIWNAPGMSRIGPETEVQKISLNVRNVKQTYRERMRIGNRRLNETFLINAIASNAYVLPHMSFNYKDEIITMIFLYIICLTST